ncbi:MAG: SMC-Scp complex subunit ScpB [Candidatus Moranbacteria bacterium CG_4_9_14_3_um_filter_33_15]|nr:MAG: SMC-Scp complex subunit ScpB [Candidatus Moranbacteria bacterium CG08_land_8_20_14_0_20_34_16]PJA89503.1 MAG: SMC-Scp complex subunit ScpB [Candidatus Moranbacteria bacterium CG_4_9_14_3_um_filter_33_15]
MDRADRIKFGGGISWRLILSTINKFFMEKEKSILESLLFVSGEPLSLEKISKISKIKKEDLLTYLGELQEEYLREKRGMIILEKGKSFQMVTRPENSEFVSSLVKGEIAGDLSQAALEVISIVAYRGPVSRADIEVVRGVNCSFTLRSLLMRGLLERVENPNNSRTFLYEISFDFLKKLGLKSVKELPDWEKISKDKRAEDAKNLKEKKDESGENQINL